MAKRRQTPAKRSTPPQRQSGEDERKVDEIVEVVYERVTAHFSGPLPPPQVLKGYEDVLPGLAERIVKMAEQEQGHRHTMDRKVVGMFSRGQWLGFLLGLIAIGLGAWLISKGYDIGGLGVLIGSLALIITSLIFGSRKPKDAPED